MESSVLISCLKSVPSNFPTNSFGLFLWFPPYVSEAGISLPIFSLRGWQKCFYGFWYLIWPSSPFLGLCTHFCKALYAPTYFAERQMTQLSPAVCSDHSCPSFTGGFSPVCTALLSVCSLYTCDYFSPLPQLSFLLPKVQLQYLGHNFRFWVKDWKHLKHFG